LGDAFRVAAEHEFEPGYAEVTHRHEYIGAMSAERRLEPPGQTEANRDLDAGLER
jgi:hypothetical protein